MPGLSDNLTTLSEKLTGKSPDVTVTTDKAHVRAVCWNWAFFGGTNEMEPDPRWAFEFAVNLREWQRSRSADKGPEPVCVVAASPAVLTELAAAAALSKQHRYPSGPKYLLIYGHILNGLLSHYGITEQLGSKLELVFYFQKGSGLMYHHVELLYDNKITITKGGDEALKAFNGVSVVPGHDIVSMKVKINPNSLKAGHVTCIADLALKAALLA